MLTCPKQAVQLWKWTVPQTAHLFWGRRCQCSGQFCSLAVNNLDTNFDVLLYLCKLLNPTAASLWCRVVSWLLHMGHTHTFTRCQLELGVCVCVCSGDLPAISITVSAAKWGERHRQPTGMLPLFWGSGSRGPDCFAQGQHDLGIVIYILVDCVLFFLRATQEAQACNRLARIWHQLHTT